MHAGVLQLCHSGNVEVREELARISPLLPLWPLNWGHQAWWQTPLCKAALISYPRQCLWTAQNEPANPDPDPCSVFTILKAWYILHVNLKRSFIICKPEVAGFQSQTLASPRMVQWSLQYWLWHFEQRRTFFLSVQKAFHQGSPYRASMRTSKRHRCGWIFWVHRPLQAEVRGSCCAQLYFPRPISVFRWELSAPSERFPPSVSVPTNGFAPTLAVTFPQSFHLSSIPAWSVVPEFVPNSTVTALTVSMFVLTSGLCLSLTDSEFWGRGLYFPVVVAKDPKGCQMEASWSVLLTEHILVRNFFSSIIGCFYLLLLYV